jgi:hypothetical protein
MELLAFKKISKNSVFIDNIFYGRKIDFSFQCDRRSFEVEIGHLNTQFSAEIGITIGAHPCTLLLEILPPLATFSQQFEGIDLASLPENIRLLAFQIATETLQKHFSTILKTTVGIDSIGAPTAQNSPNGINFTITSEQNYISAGTLVAPKEILTLLAKKISATPTLRKLKDLEMTYRVCIGCTQLSREDYRNLGEEDIVFLDQYELAKSKKVDIVGLDGVKIRGSFSTEGILVEQITE